MDLCLSIDCEGRKPPLRDLVTYLLDFSAGLLSAGCAVNPPSCEPEPHPMTYQDQTP